MDFGLLYKNDNGEYVVLNDVRMADIRLASLVYLRCLRLQVLRAYCTFASKQAVSITLFGPCPNNKTFSLRATTALPKLLNKHDNASALHLTFIRILQKSNYYFGILGNFLHQ